MASGPGVAPDAAAVVAGPGVDPDAAVVYDKPGVDPDAAVADDEPGVAPDAAVVDDKPGADPDAAVADDEPGADPDAAVADDEPGVVPGNVAVDDAAEVDHGVADTAASSDDDVEPLVYADTAVVSDASTPVSDDAVLACTQRLPNVPVFPNGGFAPSYSSSAEADNGESDDNPNGVHTSCVPCNTFSSQDLHHNKNWGRCHSNSSHGYNVANDTSALPMDATTSHSRKTCHAWHQEQGRHSFKALQPHPVQS